MSDNQAREKLLDLLDKKAFDPVLKASPDDYKPGQGRGKPCPYHTRFCSLRSQ